MFILISQKGFYLPLSPFIGKPTPEKKENLMNAVNTNELKALYINDKAAKVVLDTLSGYRRSVRESKLENLCAEIGGQLTYAEVLAVARKLEKAGVGDLIVGRKGGSTRMRWELPVMNISKYASGEIEDVSAPPKTQMVEHSYMVRPNVIVKFDLPSDITTSEAQRLGDFVRTLYYA